MAIPARSLRLRVLDGTYLYCRLNPGDRVPDWADDLEFSVAIRTKGELGIVCPARNVPKVVKREGPWKILVIDATLDFNQVGIIASLTAPLAEAGLSIAPIASFDTDYILVREGDLAKALEALRGAGHQVA
ncbi:MAG: ACT domain-containing protein [Phycisphaerales bacterium]